MEKRIVFVGLGLFLSLLAPWTLALSAPSMTTSFTVNSTADLVDDHPGDGICHTAAGACTLRAAIMEANHTSNASILLPSGTFSLTIPWAWGTDGFDGDDTGDLNIKSSMTITGAGSNATIIDGNGNAMNDRVLSVAPGAVATITGVTFRNGKDTGYYGGAIDNYGTLTLASCLITNNSAQGGGGIYNEDGATLTLDGVTVSANTVSQSGGGIFNTGNLFLSNSIVSTNTVSTFAGGGILNTGAGVLNMTGGTVSNNSAAEDGGGLYITAYTTATLSNVTIRANTTITNGGGIWNAGVLTVTGSQIHDNSARQGGGLWTYADVGSTSLNSSAILRNTASNDGGGIYKGHGQIPLALNGTQVSANSAGGRGGGIYIQDTFHDVAIQSSTIRDNSAFSYGGGAFFNIVSTVLITGSTVSGNSTNSSSAHGGGLFNGGVLTVTNSTVSGNWGVGYGGGVYNDHGASLGLNSATVAFNVSGAEYGGWPGSNYPGGGVANNGGTAFFKNTILAQNTREDGAFNLIPDDGWGTLTSQDYDLIQTITGTTIIGTLAHNKTGLDPMLGPLQDNGGLTFTHALLAGSPAIDAGNPAGCNDWRGTLLPTDQRGYPRPIDGDHNGSVICDMGPFEYGSTLPHWIYVPLLFR